MEPSSTASNLVQPGEVSYLNAGAIPLAFYFHEEEMLIRPALTAGAAGCKYCLHSRFSTHRECLFVYLFLQINLAAL